MIGGKKLQLSSVGIEPETSCVAFRDNTNWANLEWTYKAGSFIDFS